MIALDLTCAPANVTFIPSQMQTLVLGPSGEEAVTISIRIPSASPGASGKCMVQVSKVAIGERPANYVIVFKGAVSELAPMLATLLGPTQPPTISPDGGTPGLQVSAAGPSVYQPPPSISLDGGTYEPQTSAGAPSVFQPTPSLRSAGPAAAPGDLSSSSVLQLMLQWQLCLHLHVLCGRHGGA